MITKIKEFFLKLAGILKLVNTKIDKAQDFAGDVLGDVEKQVIDKVEDTVDEAQIKIDQLKQ